MLAELGSGPDSARETRAAVIGRTVGFFCHISGWFFPMYGAGKLESRNIREYETAARYAVGCGQLLFVRLSACDGPKWSGNTSITSVLRLNDTGLSGLSRSGPNRPQNSVIRASFDMTTATS
jgi:hypothetical protein